MTDVKLSLKIELPGGTLFSKQLCFENSVTEGREGGVEVPVEGMTGEDSFFLTGRDPETGKRFSRRYVYRVRKCVPAHQVIQMSEECYGAAINPGLCPGWFKAGGKLASAKAWAALTDERRLRLSMERVAESLGGRVVEYHVLGD